MKRLGIDFGSRRLGLALSDPGGTLAFPYATLERGAREALFVELLRIIESEGVQEVVVGYPVPAGEEGLIQRQVKNFVASLGRRMSIPVRLIDETLSSAQAEEDLRGRGLRGEKLAKALDQQAAVRILETYQSRLVGH